MNFEEVEKAEFRYVEWDSKNDGENLFFALESENDGYAEFKTYRFILEKKEDTWYPIKIEHSFFIAECYCRNKENNLFKECTLLNNHKEIMFERIKKHPSVRLRFLTGAGI